MGDSQTGGPTSERHKSCVLSANTTGTDVRSAGGPIDVEFYEFEDAARLVTIRSVEDVETADVESSLVRLLLRVTPEQRSLLDVVRLKARLRERGAIVVKDAVTTIRDRSGGPHRRQKRRDGVEELVQWLRGSGEDEGVVARAVEVLGVVTGR